MSTRQKKPPASALPQATAAAPATMPDPDTLAAARARIDGAAAILTGFHRRHKNQHRVSTYWWPALGQLRRHVRRMGTDLAEAPKRPAKIIHKGGKHPAAARARWIRLHFVPKAYVAFSRLVVDRRFAPLGLLLMGVLAEVHAVTRSLDPEGDVVDKDDIHDAASDSGSDSDDAIVAAKPSRNAAADTRSSEPADIGVAVPRDEDGCPATKRARTDVVKEGDEATAVAASSTAKKRKGERSVENTDVSPAKSERKEQKEKKEKREKKEKKTKKKNRDEFDDLFSGLV